MKIALLNEFSQASKNNLIFKTLKNAVEPLGHKVFNAGMHNPLINKDVSEAYSDDNPRLTYLHIGIEAALLLNSQAVDFVITGCGTGQGALMSLNSYPGVVCGYCLEPTDAYLYLQINNGNALSIPFAKGFGWGAEINLKNIFTVAFSNSQGLGYPKENRKSQNENAMKLFEIKSNLCYPLLEALSNLDSKLLQTAIIAPNFKKCFLEGCKDQKILDYVNQFYH